MSRSPHPVPPPQSRPPRYLVAVNVSRIAGKPDEWEELSMHATLLEAIHSCSEFQSVVKTQMGVRFTSPEADYRIEPCILVIDLKEERTVVWVQDGQLHCTDSISGTDIHLAPPQQAPPVIRPNH